MSHVHAMPVMLGALAALAVAYRYYSAFLAAKVAALDDSRVTPAHEFQDGQNYHPTNRFVLFGHHFAAISGAGPLIGPVLAIQFGYLPGLIWLVVGVCLAGAVQDMMVLAASVRRGGRSLASLARTEVGPLAGLATTLAILYVIIIALAGLGIVVVKALGGEEVAMKGGTTLTAPADGYLWGNGFKGAPLSAYDVPPGSTYRFGPGPDDSMVFHEGFQLAVPPNDSGGARLNGPLVLPDGAKRLVRGSSWGAFTIACTVPIAFVVGFYMYKVRKGRVLEASVVGALAVLGVTYLGAFVPGSRLEPYFLWSKTTTTYAIAGYGFVAAILPVWLLLCPRDYLSSFLKVGTIALLVVGVVAANPTLEAPAINHQFAGGGGPYFDGPIFPYVFICIMCGAVSGFHALVASGTTPKMVNREGDVRMIGYGAMLMEGLVGIVALIAAAALPNSMYYDINIDLARRPQFQQALKALDADHDGQGATELVAMERNTQESLHGRTGGAVTLAVGMARIFSGAIPGHDNLIKYWYHFAIMFEALFILTTIDTGTRIGRFLVQEVLGKLWRPLGDLDRLGPALLATALVVFGWSYFILTGSVETIWPMFGVANQLLAVIALAVATTITINLGRAKYAWTTLLPLLFVATTTTTAGVMEITGKFTRMTHVPATRIKGYLNIGLTATLLVLVAIILASSVAHWLKAIRAEPSRPV